MDDFFTGTNCDRCGSSLEKGRIMSMFNEDCICLECKNKERDLEEYRSAQEKEVEQIRKGNLNYKGVGYNH